MLAIRMQRTGRKGHASFRVIVQDSRQAPNSGRVVAQIGHYDPHTKAASVNKDKATFYLEHGAQPSLRVARLFQGEGIKLPKWVVVGSEKTRDIRNPEKLRKNRPADVEASDTAQSSESSKTQEANTKPKPVETETVADVAETNEDTQTTEYLATPEAESAETHTSGSDKTKSDS